MRPVTTTCPICRDRRATLALDGRTVICWPCMKARDSRPAPDRPSVHLTWSRVGKCGLCKTDSYLKGPRGTTKHPGCDWKKHLTAKPEDDDLDIAVAVARTLLPTKDVVTVDDAARPKTGERHSSRVGGLCFVCGAMAAMTGAGGRWLHPGCAKAPQRRRQPTPDPLGGVPLDGKAPVAYVGIRIPDAALRDDVLGVLGDAINRNPGDLTVVVKTEGRYLTLPQTVEGSMSLVMDVRRVLGPMSVVVRRAG